MSPIIYLIRHAQGYHNLSVENEQLPDPILTSIGKEQCRDLQNRFTGHNGITHLVASPLRRTLYTCLLSFGLAKKHGKHIIALPDAQEISRKPCDIGSEFAKLEAEFGDRVDLSLISDGWNDKSPLSVFAPETEKLEQRARRVRLLLQGLAKQSGEDARIVLVTHGGILHFITQEWDDFKPAHGTGWENTECRAYQFRDSTLQDPSSTLQELQSSRSLRYGSAVPLSETEQQHFFTGFSKHFDAM